MILGILQWIIISLILIILIHHLFSFFKNTLTVPKVKDLVNQPSNLYKEIEKTLNTKDDNKNLNIVSSNNNRIDNNFNNNYDINKKEMKNELKNFFNELTKNTEGKEILFNNFNSNNMFTQI
tara:strand:+ start:321 stop:686 length:366 start_codon:yes stop_codon:yes gene_type:complete